jgi:hypothetical protein
MTEKLLAICYKRLKMNYRVEADARLTLGCRASYQIATHRLFYVAAVFATEFNPLPGRMLEASLN